MRVRVVNAIAAVIMGGPFTDCPPVSSADLWPSRAHGVRTLRESKSPHRRPVRRFWGEAIEAPGLNRAVAGLHGSPGCGHLPAVLRSEKRVLGQRVVGTFVLRGRQVN